MADGMREKTTNVGGVIKRIWYAMTGATQGTELASLDDTGNFKTKNFAVQSLNTAPASPTATGTAGELRYTSSGSYICIATNSWRKALPVSAFTETITGLTSTFTASTIPAVSANLKYLWKITNTLFNVALVESTHNSYAGGNTLSLITGAGVATVTANSIYSVRIGDSVLEIKIDANTRAASYRIASGTITEITVIRLQYEVSW